MKTTVKAHLLRSTLLAALSVASGAIGSAYAQTTTTTTTEAGPEEKGDVVVVTGSRIARQDFTAVSPVTTVGAEDIELTATLSVEQLLNELPQVIPGNTITSNNAGGEDFATIDLRGLGPARTLVLLDGERVPASSTTGVVDLNTIPAGLIERIEVVTGGASAVYGSDAIAGVVNFILKKDYEGAELRSTYTASQDGKAPEVNVDFLVGGNFANGRGNLTTYASYYNREGVFQSEFDYSKQSAALVYGYDYANSRYTAAGVADTVQDWLDFRAGQQALGNGAFIAPSSSGTPPWGAITGGAGGAFTGLSSVPALAPRFTNQDTDCNPATAGANVNAGTLSFNDSGQLTPFFSGSGCSVAIRSSGSSRYNFAPDNYLIIPGQRMGIQTFGSYAISDTVDMKLFLSYVDSHSTVQLAPTPVTGLSVPVTSPAIAGPDGVPYTADDPHQDLSAALATRANPLGNFGYAWRSKALGGRIGDFTNHNLQGRVTFTGELFPGWEWNANAGYGRVNFDSVLQNNVNTVALNQGLAGCANIPVTARLTNCVNVDIFGANATNLAPAAANFISTNVGTQATFEQVALSGYVRGDLFALPAGPVAAVFGLEYREDSGKFLVDDAQRRGEIAGFNAVQSVFGGIDVTEAYTEIRVPILSNMPFAYDLSLETGYRVSDYSTVGSVDSYKAGLQYSPFQWITARAIYNKATRAPNLSEIGTAGDQGFGTWTEPCRSSAANPAVPTANSTALKAFCIAQGVPAGNYTSPTSFAAANSQVQQFAFGNPNLEAEDATTTTAGIVFKPDFLPVGNLNVSVDYYHINIKKAIIGRGTGAILASCYGPAAGGGQGSTPQSVADCANVVRDPASGQVLFINTSLQNGIADLDTEGVDVQADYGFDLDEFIAGIPGRLNVNVLASFLSSYDSLGTELAGTTFAGIGGATPDWKTVSTIRYDIGDWLFQLRHSYVPELEQAGLFANFPDNKSPEFSNFDLSVRWNMSDALQWTLVVEDLFDDLPPQTAVGVFDQGNVDAALFSPWSVGRKFSLSARLRF